MPGVRPIATDSNPTARLSWTAVRPRREFRARRNDGIAFPRAVISQRCRPPPTSHQGPQYKRVGTLGGARSAWSRAAVRPRTGHQTGQIVQWVSMIKDRTISATEFKAKCLSILEQLDSRGIVVTKRGRPLARVLPARPLANERLIGSMKGRIAIKGDLFSTGVRWDADTRHSHRRGAARRRAHRS